MKAAIDQGNHFILTSRTHIWNEANPKLGTRNHPLLANGKSIVNVGYLSPEERQQILYNHVKAGQQKKQWRALIKPHLTTLAEQVNLLPEIARRLGDPNYTSAVKNLPNDLIRFVREPQEFLKGTIRELVVAQQAAMTLVFLARSRLPVHDIAGDECKLVADKYATSVAAVAQALQQLEGAFLIKREEHGQLHWCFVHPTFADAVSSILSGRPDLVELYLRGSRLETLLAEAVCEDATNVDDAVVVPASSTETLIDRLLETPNEKELNERLFQFLNRRAGRGFVERILRQAPELLNRKAAPSPWIRTRWQAEILLRATASSMNLLSEDLRLTTLQTLETAAYYSLDTSFLSDESILAMLRPYELMKLTIKLVAMLEDDIPSKISDLESDADADGDIDDQFESVESFINNLRWIVEDDERISDRLDDLKNDINAAKREVESRKSTEDSESFFRGVPSASIADEATYRSIFSDVDE